MRTHALIASVAALLVAAAPAAATGPSYPGETLSISLNGAAVAGQVTSFTASGTDPDANAGGYTLNVYTKPTSVDPTCAPDDISEDNTWGADLHNEFHPVVGDVETVDPGPFSTVFKTTFAHPGQPRRSSSTSRRPGPGPAPCPPQRPSPRTPRAHASCAAASA
jgi:hypothetical protein